MCGVMFMSSGGWGRFKRVYGGGGGGGYALRL